MPVPVPIRDRDLDLERTPPGLTRLTANSLGNAGTPEDGHDADFFSAVNLFHVGGAEFADLEPSLNAHFTGAVSATGDTLAGEKLQLAADVEAGNALLDEGGNATAGKSADDLLATKITPPPEIGAPGTIAALLNKPGKG